MLMRQARTLSAHLPAAPKPPYASVMVCSFAMSDASGTARVGMRTPNPRPERLVGTGRCEDILDAGLHAVPALCNGLECSISESVQIH